MKIQCPNCKKVYQVNDSKIPDAGANIKCKCETKFFIKKDSVEPEEKQKADEALKAAMEASEKKEIDKRGGIYSSLYCSRCGKQIPDESKYCSHCGALINKDTEQTLDYKKQIPFGNPIKDFKEPALTEPISFQKMNMGFGITRKNLKKG